MNRRKFVGLLGASAAWPLSVSAQQAPKSYRVGYLALLAGEDATLAKPLLERLRSLSAAQGASLVWQYRSAEGRPERLSQLAAELVGTKPDVLIAGFGTLAAKAAKAATATLPVVFTSVGDPVGAGLVASLGQPGGNVTGFTSQASDISAKRLQILTDLIQGRRPLAILLNPDTPFTALALKEVRAAADARHQVLIVVEVRTADRVAASMAAAIEAGAAGWLTLDDPLLLGVRKQITAQVAAARLPAIYGTRDFVEADGLMAYGVDRRKMSLQAAGYVDKILSGTRPEDLPVQQPTNFEFVVNLRAAKAIGLVIPSALLAQADDVIE